MPGLVDVETLRDRISSRGMPAPKLDADLERVISTAGQMVIDRTLPFDLTNPPIAVQEAVLLLALQMRMAETVNATDAEGRPIQVRLWTSALDDILGRLLRDSTPAATSPAAGTARTARSTDHPSEYRRPCGVGYPEYWE